MRGRAAMGRMIRDRSWGVVMRGAVVSGLMRGRVVKVG